MPQSSQVEPLKKKPFFMVFCLVLGTIIIFAGLGYYYLTYRNTLMRDAVRRSGRMSVRTQTQRLERELYSLEHRLILEVVSKNPETLTSTDLANIGKRHPLMDTICLASGERIWCDNETETPWFAEQLANEITSKTREPLILQHFASLQEDGLPRQAGYILLNKQNANESPLYLLFSLDLDFVNHILMPVVIDAKNPLLSGSEFTLGKPLPASAFQSRSRLYVEYGFQDILPFWTISSYIGTTGMRSRARMECVIYSGFIVLVILLTVLSSYFIWKQIHQERELSQVKSQMISHVSHELKTPLSLIRMYAETLMLGRIKEEGKTANYFQTILSECDRLHLLINNILDFSSIEKGVKEYNFTEANIGVVVADMVSSYEPYIRGQGFTFRAEIDRQLPRFFFDKLAVNQIVGNLLDNGMKFSPNKKHIELAVGQEGEQVRIIVTDCGIGMASEELSRIFTPYHRLSKRFRGSGLGLSLVQHAVRAHGGNIEVKSSLGEGSTFTVFLRVQKERADVV